MGEEKEDNDDDFYKRSLIARKKRLKRLERRWKKEENKSKANNDGVSDITLTRRDHSKKRVRRSRSRSAKKLREKERKKKRKRSSSVDNTQTSKYGYSMSKINNRGDWDTPYNPLLDSISGATTRRLYHKEESRNHSRYYTTSTTNRNRSASRSPSWGHDKYHEVKDVIPAEAPYTRTNTRREYSPPPETWKSKAGGVFIPL